MLENVPTKYKVAAGGFILAGAFAAGRYTVPEKVRIETKIVEVEKKNSSQDKITAKNVHKKVTTQTLKKPDGEEEITTTSTEDTVDVASDKDTSTTSIASSQDNTKEITANQQKVTLSALAGISPLNGQLSYGLSVTKPILGPFTIGLWGLYGPPTPTAPTSSAVVGASVGWTF